ncbi:MAG: hypothetical protein M1833_005679 [Piccolia ochrophora]|nr:MAG: hypothetical protein M1833_005679 [Piccolia ochrophora]
MPSTSTRPATHAGSWYTSSGSSLRSQLSSWVSAVSNPLPNTGPLPVPNARVIIAPHAGYSYSGSSAAYAYASLDVSQAKRVFLLGPSHHAYLPGCALSSYKSYATPLGDLPLDESTIAELHATGKFEWMSKMADDEEHSLEMHLPYIFHTLSTAFPDQTADAYPPLIPILVGSTSPSTERLYGDILAPYLADPSNVFVISSDFCHWGLRFSYTHYLPSAPSLAGGRSLKARDKAPSNPSIADSIGALDRLAMEAVESGRHKLFLDVLKETGNTVCGRHPIGVMMAAMQASKTDPGTEGEQGRFQFVRYERSSEVQGVGESSVSYASAFAVPSG